MNVRAWIKVQNTWMLLKRKESSENDDTSEDSIIREPVLEDTVSKAEQTE